MSHDKGQHYKMRPDKARHFSCVYVPFCWHLQHYSHIQAQLFWILLNKSASFCKLLCSVRKWQAGNKVLIMMHLRILIDLLPLARIFTKVAIDLHYYLQHAFHNSLGYEIPKWNSLHCHVSDEMLTILSFLWHKQQILSKYACFCLNTLIRHIAFP